jgi:hypothetical protein
MLNGSTYIVRPVEENVTGMKGFKSGNTVSGLCVPALVTLHAAWKPLIHSLLELCWGHPVAQLPTGPTSWEGHRVPLRRSYNHRLALYSCHILGICAGQPAGRKGVVRKMVATVFVPRSILKSNFDNMFFCWSIFSPIQLYFSPFF